MQLQAGVLKFVTTKQGFRRVDIETADPQTFQIPVGREALSWEPKQGVPEQASGGRRMVIMIQWTSVQSHV